MAIDYFLIICAAILSVPLWVVACELVISLFHKKTLISGVEEPTMGTSRVRYKILIPAHNESQMIEGTLTVLLDEGVLLENIIVVADNCTDLTASIAKKTGVKVIERADDLQRGKGFALDYGINYLKTLDEPEVLIVLDADCTIDIDSLNILIDACIKFQMPQQALYLMENDKNSSLKQRVAGFAWLVKNKVRPIAVNKMRLPVTLTGTGMAFPWQVISNVRIANGNIVEDMQLGIDCTLNGFPPMFCEDAVVYSSFPEHLDAVKTQRTRWEHGHLLTIIEQVPRLFKQAVLRKNWRLFLLAIDIGVPPVALLILLTVCFIVVSGLHALFSSQEGAFYFLLISFLFFSVTLVLTWYKFGRDYLSFKELISTPIYILSKLSVYISFLFKRQTAWVRTSRDKKNDA